VSTRESQHTIERYFDLMGRGADFSTCYHADVRWLVADTGEVVEGSAEVRRYIETLHAGLVDARTRRLVVAESNAYLEGDCEATALEPGSRTHYCVAYDIEDRLITAMRCYGLGGRSPAARGRE
jgi:SnoaL-like domain